MKCIIIINIHFVGLTKFSFWCNWNCTLNYSFQQGRQERRNSEKCSDDETDYCTTNVRHDSPIRQSPRMYPNLDNDENWSPTSSTTSWSEHISPNDSLSSNRSHCSPESASLPGKQLRKEPVTPTKGSPGKKISTGVGQHEGNPAHTHRGAAPVLYIFIFFMIISCVLFLKTIMTVDEIPTAPAASQKKTIKEVHKDLLDKLKRLNLELSQPKELWVQLYGQLKSVMVDAPQQPAVVLVVMPQDSKGTTVCLVHKLAEAIKDAFEGWLIVYLTGSFLLSCKECTYSNLIAAILCPSVRAKAHTIGNVIISFHQQILGL